MELRKEKLQPYVCCALLEKIALASCCRMCYIDNGKGKAREAAYPL